MLVQKVRSLLMLRTLQLPPLWSSADFDLEMRIELTHGGIVIVIKDKVVGIGILFEAFPRFTA
jgi:hypothetical protein